MKPVISYRFTHVLVALVINSGFILLALWLGKGQISFLLFSIVLMYFGRRLGWQLSKVLLYTTPLPVAVVGCVIWGGLIAYLVHALIIWQQPHWIMKWIFGFALGAYVSIPNYGLLAESSIPDHAMIQHSVISNLPYLVFILCSILFAYML